MRTSGFCRNAVFRYFAPHTASESGAEATAVQTLRAEPWRGMNAERLDCGAFTAAFAPTLA